MAGTVWPFPWTGGTGTLIFVERTSLCRQKIALRMRSVLSYRILDSGQIHYLVIQLVSACKWQQSSSCSHVKTYTKINYMTAKSELITASMDIEARRSPDINWLLACDPIKQGSMTECVVSSWVWTIIATTALNVRSQILGNEIAIRPGTGFIHAPNIAAWRTYLLNVNTFNKEVLDEVPVSCIDENATSIPRLMFATM
jgi:hypothetical protein